jgi:hypothetical protein
MQLVLKRYLRVPQHHLRVILSHYTESQGHSSLPHSLQWLNYLHTMPFSLVHQSESHGILHQQSTAILLNLLKQMLQRIYQSHLLVIKYLKFFLLNGPLLGQNLVRISNCNEARSLLIKFLANDDQVFLT